MKTLKWTLLLPAVVAACSSDVTGPTAGMAPPTPSFAVTLDPTTGLGFVGKGEVQYTFGWNNKALQDYAGLVRFQFSSTVVTEVSWECNRFNNAGFEQRQERARTTTTTIQGLLASVARERNQVTGFLLNGFDGSSSSTSEPDGPAVNSCPNGWSLDVPAGDPVVVDAGGAAMQVSKDSGTSWTALLSPPTI